MRKPYLWQRMFLNIGMRSTSSAPYPPCWTRIWTIQEVILNYHCSVYLGDAEPIEMYRLQQCLFLIEREIERRYKQLVLTKDPRTLYLERRPPKVIFLHKCGKVRNPDSENLHLLMVK